MLPLDDPRWNAYLGGYRDACDAAPCLRRLIESGADEQLWEELWTELHHQGDVDQASYAAVPWLVEYVRRSPRLDWNAVALIATIELERPRPKNPPVAPELKADYFDAIRSIPQVLGMHPDQQWSQIAIGPATSCIALARGQRWFARTCLELDSDAARRWFADEFGLELSELEPDEHYDPKAT